MAHPAPAVLWPEIKQLVHEANHSSKFYCRVQEWLELYPHFPYTPPRLVYVDSSWNVMAHVDAREGKWRGNRWMEWVASTLRSTSEHGVSSITTADAHTSADSSRLNWPPLHRFKWTRPFRRKTKSGFCACAITFQLAFTTLRLQIRYGMYCRSSTTPVTAAVTL